MKHEKCVTRARATKMHECSSCKQERTSVVHANKICTRTVRANHNAHGNTLTSRVYMETLNMHFYVNNLSCIPRCTHRLFACIFRNVLSRVVAAHVCSQVQLEL